MSILADLRLLVLLRRIARAEERQAIALESVARVAEGFWYDQHPARKSSPVEFGVMDVEAVNERYARQLEADELGATLED